MYLTIRSFHIIHFNTDFITVTTGLSFKVEAPMWMAMKQYKHVNVTIVKMHIDSNDEIPSVVFSWYLLIIESV